jgi:hypothetical protein
MGLTKKTDKLDAKGLAILVRNGPLPEVWIPPSELRDQRELLRMRIFLVHLRMRVKNRIHGTLARHNVAVPGADLFGAEGRLELGKRLPELPAHSREAVAQKLATLDFLEAEIRSAEKRLEAIMKVSAEAAAENAALRRHHSKHGTDAGDRPSGAISRPGAPGQLCGFSTMCAFEWRTYAHGADLREREPDSEVGVRGNCQPDRN